MKKRSRPSFLRYLEGRYEEGPPREQQRKARQPAVYPVAVKRVRRAAGKGVIDMTVRQFVGLAIFFVLLACVATSATTFAVIQVAGTGPQGEQGEQGVQGQQGERGPVGLQGPAGNDASQEMIKRLAALWAVQQTSSLSGGAEVSFNDSRVGTCVNYVLTGKPDASACAGFH